MIAEEYTTENPPRLDSPVGLLKKDLFLVLRQPNLTETMSFHFGETQLTPSGYWWSYKTVYDAEGQLDNGTAVRQHFVMEKEWFEPAFIRLLELLLEAPEIANGSERPLLEVTFPDGKQRVVKPNEEILKCLTAVSDIYEKIFLNEYTYVPTGLPNYPVQRITANHLACEEDVLDQFPDLGSPYHDHASPEEITDRIIEAERQGDYLKAEKLRFFKIRTLYYMDVRKND